MQLKRYCWKGRSSTVYYQSTIHSICILIILQIRSFNQFNTKITLLDDLLEGQPRFKSLLHNGKLNLMNLYYKKAQDAVKEIILESPSCFFNIICIVPPFLNCVRLVWIIVLSSGKHTNHPPSKFNALTRTSSLSANLWSSRMVLLRKWETFSQKLYKCYFSLACSFLIPSVPSPPPPQLEI